MPITLDILSLAIGFGAGSLVALLALQRRNAQLSSMLEHERAINEEKITLLEQARQQMADTFKVMSQEALDANRENFLALAQERLKQFQDGAQTDLEKRQNAIKELVGPVTKSLDKMDQKIVELEKARQGAYGELREHLTTMKADQEKLRTETSSLVQALRSPTTRGQWGELQLKRILELAGMVEGVHYSKQVSVEGDHGKLRPDVVVNMTGGQSIIIDAKVPIDAYLDSLKDDISDADRVQARARHARHVRDHMKQLGSKSYFEQFDTPEFVVMFLPGESYFSAALEADPTLLEADINQRVILASPTTLIALLKVVAYGWQQESLAESARDISNLGKDLYKRLSVFSNHISKVGKGLNTAMSSYNDAIGSLERNVLPSARKFKELHAAPADKEIESLEPLDHTPRSLAAPEVEDLDNQDGDDAPKKAKAG